MTIFRYSLASTPAYSTRLKGRARIAPRGSIRHNRRGRLLEQLGILLLLATVDASIRPRQVLLSDASQTEVSPLAWQAEFGSGVGTTASWTAVRADAASCLAHAPAASAKLRARASASWTETAQAKAESPS